MASTKLLAREPDTGPAFRQIREWFDADGTPRPAAARIDSFWLGGFCHWSTDRVLADEIATVWPAAVDHARAGYRWYRRVVTRLLTLGVRQFVDVGGGLSDRSAIHDLADACRAAPVRAVYVDADPIAVAYNTAGLAHQPSARVVHVDPVDATAILDHPEVVDLLDLAEPTAVLLRNLHHLPYRGSLATLLHGVADTLSTGGYLAATALCHHPDLHGTTLAELYQRTPTGLHLHHVDAINAAVAAVPRLRFLPPGLVTAPAWHPTHDDPGPPAPALRACLSRLDPA